MIHVSSDFDQEMLCKTLAEAATIPKLLNRGLFSRYTLAALLYGQSASVVYVAT